MKRELVALFLAATLLYLPAVRYGFVQDDRAIIASNPNAHSIDDAVRAFDEPYWPHETGAGLYRPVAILSFALDWTIGGGRPGWLHLMNALWHALAAVLFAAVIARWLPPIGAAVAGFVFALHPVHVEAVASLVGRAELLVAAGILGSILAARRGRWVLAVALSALAMFSKEHGVIAGVVILLDSWLQVPPRRHYPAAFWIALALVTEGFLVAWSAIGWVGTSDASAVFYGRDVWGRLAIALPAIAQAAALLFWPISLSSDYSPQVLPLRDGLSVAAVAGALIMVALPLLVIWCRRRAPAIAFAAGLALLSYLPTANLLFPSGVVLAERNLYLAVALPAALVGAAVVWARARWGVRPVSVALALLVLALGFRSLDRLPSWRDNRSQLLTLLTEHPESYRGHASAAAVLAGIGDTAGARREYRTADSLFSGDPFLVASRAIFLISIGDTANAAPLVDRAERLGTGERMASRARFLLELARGNRPKAAALAASASRRYAGEEAWYRQYR